MSRKLILLESRDKWLEARKGKIGGSDASAVIGRNPYKSNVDLWKEKTGRVQAEDISEKPYVMYGTKAEAPLRDLFALDFPEYEVHYQENNMFLNEDYPFAHASLDGWLTDQDGRFGVLEIKTAEILRSMAKENWKNQIPDNYYVQILHQMLVTEADFAVLKAQLKYDYDGDVFLQTKHYFIERSEIMDDIEYLLQSEQSFAKDIIDDHCPALLLPEI